MGEMIKFGIKMALTIACAVALVAAIALLYSSVSSAIGQLTVVASITDIVRIFQIYVPINLPFIMTTVTTLGAIKVAYWAADKMIVFIDAMG